MQMNGFYPDEKSLFSRLQALICFKMGTISAILYFR